MGSRVQLNFNALLNEPRVRVEFYVEQLENQPEEVDSIGQYSYVQRAKVVFQPEGGRSVEHHFDVLIGKNDIFLECDYNLLRWVSPDSDVQILQRAMFECCVVHRVIPG